MTRTSFLSGTFPRRLLAVGAAVGLAITLLPAGPAEAATNQRVKATFFGMHDGDPTSWPAAPVGNIRLWDSGVSWREIETANGVFDFSRLDAEINTARAHGARVLLVLGQTPRFHSTRPGKRGSYGLGAASMPTQSSWTSYVYRVVNRYKGRGVDYQVWNEANVAGYWNGSAAQMAKLTRWTSRIVNNNDSAANVVAPALATRLTGQRSWLRSFYAQRTGGKKVSAYVDAVSLNLYPMPKQAPEASMKLLAASRVMLSRAGVSKPIWNTEINYGLLGGGTASNISRAKEASFMARTLVLNAQNNVKRMFWYAWDLQNLANTQLTYTNGSSLTRAGTAYKVVRGWLLYSRTKGCVRDRKGTYTCTFAYSGGIKRVYWNPSRKVTVRAVKSARESVGLYGVPRPLSGGEAIGVGKAPVMVRSAR
jgi:polysaccharide biosynthesis protein PslG